ncbi:MAG TPA: DUF5996 family protein [Ignavibacteria bacterium]|nr:DUF5996 family protein [Ignavibacteria bacterium]HRA99117.1 DUF5996 family protein [Ignavibacteria bacterium]
MKLPYLPYDKWTDTRITLHLIFQIIGKIRLKTTPRKNHWWYVTLYLSPKGFSTDQIPMSDGLNTFEIIFNVHKKAVQLYNSKGEEKEIPLENGYTVSEFYKNIMGILNEWDLHPEFIDKPMDMITDKPFDKITEFHHYDWDSINLFWQMMLWNDGVFKEFSGRFYGKTCPVHMYWHHMDLAVTRFSGKPAPPMPHDARISDKDAYSHEVISFGFWAGDDNLPEPAYYSYTAPAPKDLDKESIKPEQAFWMDANGSPMAILKYKDLLNFDDPRKVLMEFLESAYLSGAKLAGWDIEAFKVTPLKDL